MELIQICRENLEKEHICCAISNNRDCQVAAKKAWLADRLEEGLVFLKGDVRGKCFIEYIPAERAWAPVAAEGYMYIDCLWVSGQLAGQGNAGLLLDECIRDSREKGKRGLVTLSSPKKRAFLADPKFLRHKGFSVVDTAPPYFELLCLPFAEGAPAPRFLEHVKTPPALPPGFVLYYAYQCPFTARYVPLLEAAAAARGVPFQACRLTDTAAAQAAPSPFTSFGLFYNSEFVTHEILSVPRFEKLLTEMGL